MPDKASDPAAPKHDPAEKRRPVKVNKPTPEPATDDEAPPAGEGEAANDRELDKGKEGDDEETMPMEEGFSLVP